VKLSPRPGPPGLGLRYGADQDTVKGDTNFALDSARFPAVSGMMSQLKTLWARFP